MSLVEKMREKVKIEEAKYKIPKKRSYSSENYIK